MFRYSRLCYPKYGVVVFPKSLSCLIAMASGNEKTSFVLEHLLIAAKAKGYWYGHKILNFTLLSVNYAQEKSSAYSTAYT